MLQQGDSGDEVAALQQRLHDLGYDPGPVDGDFGPLTQAAVQAFQRDKGLSPDGVVGPQTRGALDSGSGGGGGVPGVDEDAIRRRWPQLAFLLNDPDVGPILRDFYAHPEKPDSEFQAAIMGTNWYRRNPNVLRNNLALEAVDPATYMRRVQLMAQTIDRLAGQNGITLTPQRREELARQSVLNELTETEILENMFMFQGNIGGVGPVQQQIREAYNDYLLPLDDATLKSTMRRIVTGQWTVEGLRAELANQTKRFYPHMAAQIDAGMTPREWFGPYRSQIATLMEVNPAQVDPTDPKWRPVFDSMDPQGNHRSLTLWETAEYVRKMPEWRKTRQARDQVAALGETLLREFGAVARS